MNKLWGGRFSGKEIDPEVMKFTSSLDVDKVLAKYDCHSSKVHVDMLSKKGFISGEEKKILTEALDELAAKIEDESVPLEGYEDIHSFVQDYVARKSPDAAKKMHTGRSRNEQVVNDVRLYVKDSIRNIKGFIKEFQKEMVGLAERSDGAILPGYTHLNRAQPVLFAHLIMAYVEMMERDIERLDSALCRTDISVMGSGALAGSALDIDRKFVAERSGFAGTSPNSIDAVSDRDFIAEFIGALCLTGLHLSRICEDLILYGTPEFGFLQIGEKYCTGSSLMPQKKNPDVLELVRGRSSQLIGAFTSIFVLLKGLPHSYNRDMQEDKKPLFESVDNISGSLRIMKGVMSDVVLNRENMLKALENEFIYATDIAEYLVRKGESFGNAHNIVGGIVKQCSASGKNISDLSLAELKEHSDDLEEDVYGLLDPETSVKNKVTAGSTNPGYVGKEIARWQKKLK
ncbi:MAG: argininosuccinate lyase [Candidatus Omnitrophota bacterium]